MDIQKAVSDFQKKNAVNPNVGYRIFLAMFAACMLLFLTSTFWLPSATPTHNTALGTSYTCGNVTLTLARTTINPTTGYLNVILAATGSEINPTYSTTARKNTAQSVLLDSKVIFNEDNALIIEIQTGAADWDYLSLWIYPGEEPQDAEADDSIAANILCDRRVMTKDPTLVQMTGKEYRSQLVQEEIAGVEQSLEECHEKIKQHKQDIVALKAEIGKTQINQTYETDEEIQASNQQIAGYYSDIKTLEANITEQEDLIKGYEEKIKKLEEKQSDIEHGTTPKPKGIIQDFGL